MAGLAGLDLTQRVVNVHWESGLAVDFGKQAEDAAKPAGTLTISTSQNAPKQKKQMRSIG